MVSWRKYKSRLCDKLAELLELDKDFKELNKETSEVHSRLIELIDANRILRADVAELRAQVQKLAGNI